MLHGHVHITRDDHVITFKSQIRVSLLAETAHPLYESGVIIAYYMEFIHKMNNRYVKMYRLIDTIFINFCSSKELDAYVRTFCAKNKYYFNVSNLFV